MNTERFRKFTELLNAYRDACYETGYYSACCEKTEGAIQEDYQLLHMDAMNKRKQAAMAINDFVAQEA